jgi:peptide-methionine (R)-S-oxide reductase
MKPNHVWIGALAVATVAGAVMASVTARPQQLSMSAVPDKAQASTTTVDQLLKEIRPESASTQMSASGGSKGGKVTKVVKTDAEWKKILTPEQFDVLRREGTERPFSHEFKTHDKGVFRCVACALDLFTSNTKFESGTGWPSFYQPIVGHVTEKTDADGMRTEVRCARCDGHLGHVFDDGPKPTGLRYCMNGVVLKFEKTP